MRWCALIVFIALAVYFIQRRSAARASSRVLARLEKHLGASDGGRGSSFQRLAAKAGRRIELTRYSKRLRTALEESGLDLSWRKLRALVAWAFLALPSLAVAATGGTLSIPPAAAIALFLPFPVLDAFRRRNQRKTLDQCERAASDIALYLRCGIPIDDAVALSVADLGPNVAEAISRFRSEVSGDGWSGQASRTPASDSINSDFELIASAVAASRETGSDIRGIMDAVGESLRQRSAIRRELYSQTMQGRLSGRIVAALPLIFLCLSALVSRSSIAALLGTGPGLLMLLVAGFLEFLGFLWIRRILDIKC